jgi:outer membrane protein assembly factor BamE (lipoprotein component of BamABCDE complex)
LNFLTASLMLKTVNFAKTGTPTRGNQTMTTWLKLPAVFVLLLISACVSAGTRAITDAEVVSRIEVGASTRADVAALLGYPLTASYGDQEETWHYTWVTAYPAPTALVPVVKAVTPSLWETTRKFAVTFNRDGIVTRVALDQSSKDPAPSG